VRGVRILDSEHCPDPEVVVTDHTALPEWRGAAGRLVRLNMISSADGGSAVAGLSGGLGNRDDHAVFGALRATADVVIVGLGTAVAEHYQPRPAAGFRFYVIADTPDISGNPALFESGQATLVLPEDAGPAPAGVPELRAGANGVVDLTRVVDQLAGKIVVTEGGPTLAGVMVSLGLVDEFFVTIAPRVVAGSSGRVVHGPDADAGVWRLEHGFVDDEGFLFLRYARP
jgi:riboflavin biosynthesis pyrimidine reductase